MDLPTHTYFDVLKLAYDNDEFWRKLIAKPAHALEQFNISLSVEHTEKLFSALRDFSLVLSFDKYRDLVKPVKLFFMNGDGNSISDYEGTGWGCEAPRVPWGQT